MKHTTRPSAKLGLLFAVIALCAIAAHGQGVRIGDSLPVLTTTAVGSTSALSPVSNAVISVCQAPANSVPCTNKAQTYTDATLTSSCALSTQVVLAGTTNCVAAPDALGNWGAWVAPGQYEYTVTANGVSSGPYSVTAAANPAGDFYSQVFLNLQAANSAAVAAGGGSIETATSTLASALTIGQATPSKKQVQFHLQPQAKITANLADGSNAICLHDGSTLNGVGGIGATGGTVPSQLYVPAGAHITNLVSACNQTGTGAQGFKVDHLNLTADPTATIDGALLDFKGQYSGTTLDHLTINGFKTGVGLRFWTDSNVTGVGTSILSGSHIIVAGASAGNTSGKPVVQFWADPSNSTNVAGLNFLHLDTENCSANTACMEYNGNSAGTNGSSGARVQDVAIIGNHIESGSQSTADGIRLTDAQNVTHLNMSASDAGSKLIRIAETYAYSARNVRFQGRNAVWPTTVENWAGAYGYSTLNGGVIAGATSVVLAAATNLYPGSQLYIQDGQNSEWVTTTSSYTSGNTTVTLQAGLAHAHDTATRAFWNPEYFIGPGTGGLNSSVAATAGNAVRSGTTATFTTTSDISPLRQGQRLWISAPSDTTLAGLYQISVGNQCTPACSSHQFQYTTSASGSYTSGGSATAYFREAINFDYRFAGDQYDMSTVTRLPNITGPVDVEDQVNPTSLRVYGIRTSNANVYSRLFMGFPNGLMQSQYEPQSLTATDAYLALDHDFQAAWGLTNPNLHVGTLANTAVSLTQNKIDRFTIGTDGNLTAQGSSAFVGPLTGTASGNIATSALDTDSTFAANSDTRVPSQKAVKTALDLKAPIASPTFTGTPAAPTASAGTSTTQLATTAFVETTYAHKPLYYSGPQTHVQSNNGSAATLYTYTMPGNTMPASGCIEILTSAYHDVGTTSTAVVVSVGTATVTIASGSITTDRMTATVFFCNNGSTSAGAQSLYKPVSFKGSAVSGPAFTSGLSQATTGSVAVTVTYVTAGTVDYVTPEFFEVRPSWP